MASKIDLHIHTTCSDGLFSPKQVIDMARKNGVDTIAISDHDSIEAYSDELVSYAEKCNIKLIPAVEISTIMPTNTDIGSAGIHILGYNFDISNKSFLEQIKKLGNVRRTYMYDVSKKLEELGYRVRLSKLEELQSVTKAHISRDIISNPENEKLLQKTFGHIPNMGEFIETIMNEGCPAYVKKYTISPQKATEIIHYAGGKVVIAHPVAYRYEDGLNEKDIENLAKSIYSDGIEANYLYLNKNNNLIDECDIWNNLAKKLNLFTTIGSDFHLSDSLHPEIGFTNTAKDFKISPEKIISNLTSKDIEK